MVNKASKWMIRRGEGITTRRWKKKANELRREKNGDDRLVKQKG